MQRCLLLEKGERERKRENHAPIVFTKYIDFFLCNLAEMLQVVVSTYYETVWNGFRSELFGFP